MRKLFTRDNFWNLMFWVSMVTSVVTTVTTGIKVIFWINLLLTPFLISKFSGVQINSENIFLNSKGEKLNDRYPVRLIPILFLSIFLFAAVGILSDKFKILSDSSDVTIAIVFGGLLFAPLSLYFIFKNCPIALIFKRKAWVDEVMGFGSGTSTPNNAWMTSSSSDAFKPSALTQFMRENTMMDLKYMSSSSNINNPNRWNR